MADFSKRVGRPIGVSSKGFGGAGLNLPATCLEGESDMVGVYDDFNDILPSTEFGAVSSADGTINTWEENGWVMTDVGVPTNDLVGMQDVADVDQYYPSCIRVYSGDTGDAGGNMQLDYINSTAVQAGGFIGDGLDDLTFTRRPFPHLWIPETAVSTEVLDNTTHVFACRIGIRADDAATGGGDWESKFFVGLAEAGDTGVLNPAGVVGSGPDVAVPTTGPLFGFTANENGILAAVSQRTAATGMVEGTNYTDLIAAPGIDGTVANGATTAGDTMWFDLALRMDITDMSDDDANGSTKIYYRGPLNRTAPTNPGREEFPNPGEGYEPWIEHATVLLNQTPNNAVALVPTIEMVNGPSASVNGVIYLDWWVFGTSRLLK